MKISGNNILSDYQALRQAASAGQSQADISLNGMPVDLVSSQIDNDPTTPDNIVVSAWDGSFSSQAAQLTFAESQLDGKQVLEFSAEQATSLFDSEKDSSKALIDMASGEVLSTSGSGNFLVSGAAAPTPVKPDPQEQENARIRSDYSELKQHLAEGEKEFNLGLSQVTVVESRPGYVELTSWDGCMSSGQAKETYREYQQDGKNMLEYTKFTPGSPFMVGSQDETFTRNLSL